MEFKRCEALSLFIGENDKKGWKTFRNKVSFPIKWFVADAIGLFGTSPIRILSFLILNILLFGLLFYINGVGSGRFGNGLMWDLMAATYYSAITSFTVGYGDISPTGYFIAGFACLEAFFGVFLMSYFTVAFARKVLR